MRIFTRNASSADLRATKDPAHVRTFRQFGAGRPFDPNIDFLCIDPAAVSLDRQKEWFGFKNATGILTELSLLIIERLNCYKE